MKKLNVLVILLGVILFSSCEKNSDNDSSSGSYTVVLQPDSIKGKDAFIEDYPNDNYRDKNYGNSVEFAAVAATSNGEPFVVRSFIDFNFDTIPANAVIDSAKLSLYAYGNAGHGMGHDTLSGTNESYLQRVISDWKEDSITWNNQPRTTDLDQVLLSKSDSAMQDYTDIDVTNLVVDMLKNKDNSFGFMLRLKFEDGYRRLFFASSDVKEKDKRPKLEIYYTVN